jgi:hypothetical protein
MNDPIRSVALAVAVLLIAWGVFGFISLWWQRRARRRQRVAAYVHARSTAAMQSTRLFNRPWSVMQPPDFSGTRNNPTADGGTDEGP